MPIGDLKTVKHILDYIVFILYRSRGTLVNAKARCSFKHNPSRLILLCFAVNGIWLFPVVCLEGYFMAEGEESRPLENYFLLFFILASYIGSLFLVSNLLKKRYTDEYVIYLEDKYTKTMSKFIARIIFATLFALNFYFIAYFLSRP